MENNLPVTVESIIEDIWKDGHPSSANSISYKNFYREIDKKIEYSLPILFGFDFPCYGDESDRIALEKHILSDYYTRRICCQSITRWMLFLKARMDDIMPRYTALYNAQAKLILSDYLNPYHVEESKDTKTDKTLDRINESQSTNTSTNQNESESSNASTNEGNDNTTSKDVNKTSNTPQALSEAVEAGNTIPLNYLSTMSVADNQTDNTYDSKSESSDTSKSSGTSTDSGTTKANDSENEQRLEAIVREVKGNLTKDNNAKLFKDYQDAIINIEKMISQDLSDLFYTIY